MMNNFFFHEKSCNSMVFLIYFKMRMGGLLLSKVTNKKQKTNQNYPP